MIYYNKIDFGPVFDFFFSSCLSIVSSMLGAQKMDTFHTGNKKSSNNVYAEVLKH